MLDFYSWFSVIIFILFVIWLPLVLTSASAITSLFSIGIKSPRCWSQTCIWWLEQNQRKEVQGIFCFLVIYRFCTWDGKVQRWSVCLKTFCVKVFSHGGPHSYYCLSQWQRIDVPRRQGGPLLSGKTPYVVRADAGSMTLQDINNTNPERLDTFLRFSFLASTATN